ncbi:MAG: twin-arginine translocase TatA/TatE family subunit [Armatimonadota bacterium]
MFGSLGFGEVMLILIIGLIIFGPKKLPEIGRSLGNAIREFRKASNDIVNTFSLDTDYTASARHGYSDYSASYGGGYAESSSYLDQTVSQSDVPGDDVNVAQSPEEPYSVADNNHPMTETASSSASHRARFNARRVLASARTNTAHRNTRRRV